MYFWLNNFPLLWLCFSWKRKKKKGGKTKVERWKTSDDVDDDHHYKWKSGDVGVELKGQHLPLYLFRVDMAVFGVLAWWLSRWGPFSTVSPIHTFMQLGRWDVCLCFRRVPCFFANTTLHNSSFRLSGWWYSPKKGGSSGRQWLCCVIQ